MTAFFSINPCTNAPQALTCKHFATAWDARMNLSYLFYDPIPELAELDRRMRHLASLGYRGIELSAFHPLPYAIDDVLSLGRTHNLPVVSLLSGWSYANEKLCLSSPEAGTRKVAVERLGEYARQAGRLGAIVVVGLMQGLRSDEADEAPANERIADCLRPVAKVAAKQGTTIVS